jgi:hypothetical protein
MGVLSRHHGDGAMPATAHDIKMAGGLMQKQNPRPAVEGTGQNHSLFLTA